MAVRKPINQTGRIIAGVLLPGASSTTPEALYYANNTQDHGPMASRFGLNTLVCFYCNKRSGIKYDGFLTHWECRHCGSENFLDEVRHTLFAPGMH